ncbi:T7SS effector LXG polymorphic toxin [Thermocaproicibacter melissae]|uniref:T7SS effector LXG polymorphic toxin n=1 Tax=Thermocaproicibacter melissae TaxID=2966552 RepID=UPI0024B145AE|nr:T7SS effector LXG polymorphic toxin [Thermocaproicibacter melissae]WBY64040.1 T7SS effector LXG polymorphic toxin [Thermocaproicibacter melissae]
MAVFLNEEIQRIADDATKYCKDLEEALYDQYKSAYCLVYSNNFYGGSADSYKEYIEKVSIYFINRFLNTVDEMGQVIGSIKDLIASYESDSKGIVDQKTVENVSKQLSAKMRSFSALADEIQSIDSEAASYISVISPSFEAVEGDFNKIQKNLSKVQNDFVLINSQAEKKASSLYDHIAKLASDVATVDNSYHYAGNDRINYDKLAQITSEKWYQPESNTVLNRLLTEDPFSYQAGHAARYENQWATGLNRDIYAYAGASFLSGNYESKHDDGVYEFNADGSVLSGNAYAQATDWARISAEASAVSGSVKAKAGWSDKYKGFRVEGEGAVAKAEGSLKVGTDDFNGYIKGDAEFCSANGYVTCEFKDKNNFSIGFNGEAAFAKAEASSGFSFLNLRETEKDKNGNKEEINLFRFHVSAKAEGGGSIGAGISSKNLYDSSFVDINAVTVQFNFAALLGFSINATIPVLSFG